MQPAQAALVDYQVSQAVSRLTLLVRNWVDARYQEHCSSEGRRALAGTLAAKGFFASCHRLRGIAFLASTFENCFSAGIIDDSHNDNSQMQVIDHLLHLRTKGVQFLRGEQSRYLIVTERRHMTKWADRLSRFLGVSPQICEGTITPQLRRKLNRGACTVVTSIETYIDSQMWLTHNQGLCTE